MKKLLLMFAVAAGLAAAPAAFASPRGHVTISLGSPGFYYDPYDTRAYSYPARPGPWCWYRGNRYRCDSWAPPSRVIYYHQPRPMVRHYYAPQAYYYAPQGYYAPSYYRGSRVYYAPPRYSNDRRHHDRRDYYRDSRGHYYSRDRDHHRDRDDD